MILDIKEVEKNFVDIVESLTNGNEKVVYLSIDGKPVAKMVPLTNSKRVGAAKEEMKGFDISLEEFNGIPSLDFN